MPQTRREWLDDHNAEWASRLRGVSLIAEAEIPEEDRSQAASALGYLYQAQKLRTGTGAAILVKWRACLVASMSGVAVMHYQHGTYWPVLWEAVGFKGHGEDQSVWGKAFIRALSRLGLPTFSDSPLRYLGPILMHAGIPANCLGDFFRLLTERRRQEPGLDADAFLSWATAPGRELRLSELDKPAERFLLNGGDYAYDIVDRTIDLLDRLSESDPDLDGVRLPAYMIEAAQRQLESGELDLSGTQRRHSHAGAGTVRQAQPRIALDPYGQGVHVVLPPVGDTPDGVARWRITADGQAHTVQSRAMWVGAAETTPQTAFPLNRPVRTVLVSLTGHENLATELRVVEQSDPVLFFGEDGRRLANAMSLPKGMVWIMHPAGSDRDLEFTGDPGRIIEPDVPFGWEGWRLRFVSLENVQAVALQGGRMHPVEGKARPRLLLGEPLTGVTTPFGSPVYPVPPRLSLPGVTGTEVKWHVEVRRTGDLTALVSREIAEPGEADIWDGVPRPVLGSFQVTVRGPLGQGMRRTIFIAEGLAVRYEPSPRQLTRIGLVKGKASLTAAIGAVVSPAALRLESGQRSRPVEYRTDDESEPLVITPPHAAVLCPDAGVTTWTTSPLHLVAEDFSVAGRLLVRGMTGSQGGRNGQPELGVYVSGDRVQVIEASNSQAGGIAGFELGRAADTIATHRRAELALELGDTLMPVATVRPRKLASGVDLDGDMLVLRDHVRVDGLTAGIYLVYAPWRPPAEVSVAPDGTVALPNKLRDAGPLCVLLAIDDPWDPIRWPAWPGTAGYRCEAAGIPASDDPSEAALSAFVAGARKIPESTSHQDWLWWLITKSGTLAEAGARPDLANRCAEALCGRPREALLALSDAGLSQDQVISALIMTGIVAEVPDLHGWLPTELAGLEKLWTVLPVAAAIATGDIITRADVVGVAAGQCGESLTEILGGKPDPHAGVGRFGLDAERLALLAPEQVDSLWQAAAVVPHALLDADTRAAAARRMFDARDKTVVRTAAASAKAAALSVKTLISQSTIPHLADAITARLPREHKGGWLALPAMSIALALMARLAARGNPKCRALEREFRGEWITLVQHAPHLVAIDLVLAEALIVGAVAPLHMPAEATNADLGEDHD